MNDCQVRFTDKFETERVFEVKAENLFDAVAMAVNSLRTLGYDVGGGCQFKVQVEGLGSTSTHILSFDQVEDFAKNTGGQGQSILRSKSRVARLLGIAVPAGETREDASSSDRKNNTGGTSEPLESIVIERTASGYRPRHLVGLRMMENSDHEQVANERELMDYLRVKAFLERTL